MERRRHDHDPCTILLNLKVEVCSTCSSHGASTAVCETSGAGTIHVTLCVAGPPRVSRLLVCCSGSLSASEPYIVATELNIILLAVGVASKPLCSKARYEYFVYRLAPGEEERPSLELISASISLDDSHVGLLPCNGFYIVAALCYTSSPDKYDLHLYNSETRKWTTDLGLVNKHQEHMDYYHANHKVITSGGEAGTMAFWCDLSHGGILCSDVLCSDRQLHYITLPPPILQGKKLKGCPRSCRDIAVVNGRIHYVELQIHAALPGTSIRGFTLVKWSTSATGPWHKDCWQQDYRLDASQISVPADKLELLPKPQIDTEGPAQQTLVALHMGHPTLSLHAEQIVYLMTKVNHLDEKACVLALDMRNKTLEGVAEFTADRVPGFCFTYTHTRVSRYPDIDGNL